MADTGERPNFLIIMSDEHGPMFSSTYGHDLVKTPSMDRLAEEGTIFDTAYCNSPLCVPSRASFLTGRYVYRCGGWDNSTPMPVDAITWPYLLRNRGYDVVLSGKMHLIGPDPLHGFRAQLAVDLHRQPPGTSTAFPRWRDGLLKESEQWPLVKEAGPGVTAEIEADEASEAAALAYLRDPERKRGPWALCAGFLAPHFPFVVPEPFFSMYYPDMVDMPNLPNGHLENLPAATRRLREAYRLLEPYTDDEVRRARAAYYGLVTWMDEKIGRLLDTLEQQGLADNTVVIYTSDHGETLGEHGLWRKNIFYEQSARVPLQIRWPSGLPGGRRVTEAVSSVDTAATILELAGVSDEERRFWGMDGDSLLPLLTGQSREWKDEAFCEYEAHGTDRVRAMVRQSKWKLCYSHGDPPELELYNLETDPGEFNDLSDNPDYADVQDRLLSRILSHWEPEAITATVLASQEARQIIRDQNKGAPLF